MKNKLFLVLVLFSFFGCGKTTIYEFMVENQLSEETVKIVPKSKTDFWITSKENYTYIALPGEKIIIGAKIGDTQKEATDIYKSNDVIEPFDVYIDDIKQEKNFSLRKYWEFSVGRVNESGKYILIINEETLKD